MKLSKKCLIFMLVALIVVGSALGFSKNNKIIAFADKIGDVEVKEYCLIDSASGEILSEKNSTQKREVASMVKLMTSLLVMEKIEKGEWTLDTELNVSEYASSMEGSQAFLDAGKSYKIDDLLKSVIVASANDSSVVFAENYAGSENKFVDVMNQKAKELGLENTLYGNATGLPAPNQYSTAQDIAKLLNVVQRHDLYHKYSTIWMDKLIHDSGRVTELVNTNRLVKYYPGCDCGKTGFTDEAGYCLSASAKRNNMRLISVVMGAKSTSDRFTASSNLLNYGFSNFKSVKVVDSLIPISTTKTIKGLNKPVECVPKDDLFMVQKIGDSDKNYLIETKFIDIKSGIKKGDALGEIQIKKGNKIIAKTSLLAIDDYKSPTYFEIIKKTIDNWAF